MSIFARLFNQIPPERRQALAEATQPRAPNSDEGPFDAGRRAVSMRRIATRNMDELIGMCRMVLSDGAVEDHEAKFLLDWIEANYHAANEWPGNVLYERLIRAMTDGRIDPDEERELLDVLHKVVGGPPSADGPRVSGAIPFDDPEPEITFGERSFVLTGQFVYGSRKSVQEAIEVRGGKVAGSCSGRTDFLVIGTFGSEEWLHSTHGTKIVKAVELKAAGKQLAIVTERRWADFLG